FEPPQKKADDAMSEAEKQLIALSDDLEFEDVITEEKVPDQKEDDDDLEGWVDELDELGDDEREALSQAILPVRLALVKLRKLAFKLVNSSTKLLPLWKDIVKELKRSERIMPRDVKNRWNSTFDMLDFALDYRPAIDKITGNRS
ncbi:hypothetical protein AURDEDRAFT_49515, partial [Auricularia subglabra TFB-10046 SS5]